MLNTFTSQPIQDTNGSYIKWNYSEELHTLQETEELRAGNKLRTSVADSLEFCLHQGLPQFKGCEPTVDFIRRIDTLFDIMNSRNALGKYCKAPLCPSIVHIWSQVLEDTRDYIAGLRDKTGTPITATNRKTGFIGFLVAIQAVTAIFQEHIVGSPNSPPPLKYLLTHKLSQDQLEHFFGCICLYWFGQTR
jgi:hypothetical protein